MQRRKIVIVAISLLLVGLALPTANINRAHAFTSGNNSWTISNTFSGSNLPPGLGGGPIAQSGSTVTVTVTIQASGFNTPAYQRNVTVGIKGDWMNSYQNASVLTLTTNQIGTATISVGLPTVGAMSPSHDWTIEVWDGPSSGNIGTCQGNDTTEQYRGSGSTTACFQLATGSLTFVTADQFASAQARSSSKTITTSVGVFGLPNTAADAQIAQANSEISLGDASWTAGDFAGAKTHYQNALNDANAALATAYNLSGNQTTSQSIVSPILAAIGTVMFGLGGLLAGIGAFFYLRRRPKA